MRPNPVRWKSIFFACLALALLLPQSALTASPNTGVPPNYAWHTFYGSASQDYNISIAVDGDGNSYLTGRTLGAWLGPAGQQPLHPYNSDYDLFVLKLDSSGAYQWHTFYGSNAEDRGFSIALDAQNLVYVTGYSVATWLGDGNAAPRHPHAGGTGTPNDIFVLKLDPDGAYQWHTFYGAGGSASNDRGYSIAVTPTGELYLSGSSESSWLGEDNDAPLHPYTGSLDIFILKLDSAGNYAWHSFYGSGVDDGGLAVALDTEGALYLAGVSDATWQGDGNSAPRHAFTAAREILVLKLDQNGLYQWHTFYGSTNSDNSTAIALSSAGDIYLAGFSFGSWLGDGGAAALHAYTPGTVATSDLVILKLSSAGDYRWHTFYGSAAADIGFGIALDGDAPIVVGYNNASWLGDGNAAPLHLFTPGNNSVEYDLSIVALDSDGSYGWHTFYGSGLDDNGTSVAISRDGALHVAGYSSSSWQGDGSTAPLHSHTGGLDLLVMQFTYQRNYLPLLQK